MCQQFIGSTFHYRIVCTFSSPQGTSDNIAHSHIIPRRECRMCLRLICCTFIIKNQTTREIGIKKQSTVSMIKRNAAIERFIFLFSTRCLIWFLINAYIVHAPNKPPKKGISSKKITMPKPRIRIIIEYLKYCSFKLII